MKKYLIIFSIAFILFGARTFGLSYLYELEESDGIYVHVKDSDDFIAILNEKLLSRQPEIGFTMSMNLYDQLRKDSENIYHNILGLAYLVDNKNTSADHDYLERNVRSFTLSLSKNLFLQKAKIKFDVTYLTTLKQENELKDRLVKSHASLKLSDVSDYTKVKKIHDYIVKRVTYDESYQRYSAYDALINQSSVCEGYALLGYRMFTDAGLETRIITGHGRDQAHAWNIVKVNGKWYNIDLTWNDPITSDGSQYTSYEFFLKSEKDFYDHTRDEKYDTDEFHKKYPISTKSYKMKK